MPRINYSSDGKTTVTLPTPTGKVSVEIPPATDTGYHRRATFAALNDLINRFRHAEICHSDYWDCVKAELGVTSRKEIAEPVWALLSAEVNAARRDPQAFDRLVLKVKAYRAENAIEKAPLEDASPVLFAEPYESLSTCFVIRRDRKTSEESLVYIGEFSEDVRTRAQKHANETRCIVQLFHNGNAPENFHPETNGCAPF